MLFRPHIGRNRTRRTDRAIERDGVCHGRSSRTRVPWPLLAADYGRIRDAIESVFPDFKDFNRRIRTPGGFRLPLAATLRVWNTASGKAEFKPVPALEDEASPGGEPLLRLTTIRSHDQYNTTIYGMDDRYRGIFGRRSRPADRKLIT